ncbi:MAG TPA: TRZ/ATZ family hydrolase, partial [Methylophilaceae bacterium]
MNVDQIIAARWIIPVIPSATTLEHHALVVDGGRIVDLLPQAEAEHKYVAQRTVQLENHVLIPGLINLHTHAAMSLMRGLADDLPLMRWLNEHIWPAEATHVSEAFVGDGTMLACAEMLRGGITCFSDMYFFPTATAAAVEKAGMRAVLGLVVLDFPSAYATDDDDYLNKGFAVRDALRDNTHGRITTCLAPHAPYTVSDRSFEKILTFAEQLNLNIHTHLHETLDEITQSEAEFGLRPLQRLANLGLVGPSLIAAHGVHLTSSEIELLAEHGCHIAHCPASNLKLASGIAPIKALLTQGVNVGLGTDGAASNNALDIFAEMRLAALLAKGVSGDAEALPARQALQMATINAAKALGLENDIGSIEIGKRADLTAVDFSAAETTPCYDPLSHLVYAAGREQVSHVWVDGALLVEQGMLTQIDVNEIKEKAKLW